MASTSPSPPNPNPWAPYDSYKDCSQGICSIYCPQWCYIIFPPPPPFRLEDDSSGTDFSPLIIAVIGILASAFILVSYYTIISKYCRRRRSHDHDATGGIEFHENNNSVNNDSNRQSGQNNGGGLDETLIKSIAVCKYKKGDGLAEGITDCSVCLSEFQEGETLRLLPKCNHIFHLPCIDTWFKSHSNCPLCRANIVVSSTNIHQTPPPPPPAADHPHPPPQGTTTTTVNQYQHRNETVLVIQELETTGVGEQAVVMNLVVNDDDDDDVVLRQNTSDQVGVGIGLQVQVHAIRRSVSLNSSSVCQRPVLIADILSSNEEEDHGDDYHNQMEKNRTNRVLNLVRKSPLALKRSVSTGRFMFTRYGKAGNDSIIPN